MKLPIVIESEKFCDAISWFIDVEAITLCPFIICRDKTRETMIRHESIHVRQQLELLIIPFYLIYLLNWLINLINNNLDTEMSYYEIIFEKEAYANEDKGDYLESRKLWSCFRDLF